ncbi:hypothetical protein ACQPZG_05015 (plasmid) [Streptomyces sp. CA-294286]|uniref:hypothetical protein n=1 Tax=Streptomyces sp. CA-294286 TaxID=3240070 RepID=UPI003D8B408F
MREIVIVKKFTRLVGSSAAVIGLAGTMLITSATSASADPNFTFNVERSGKNYSIEVYNNRVRAGFADWNADPDKSVTPDIPGDALQVRDVLSDGWGIEAIAVAQVGGSGYRMATTRGHNAVYVSDWKTGNLKENTPIVVQVCAVKGSKSHCGSAYGKA